MKKQMLLCALILFNLYFNLAAEEISSAKTPKISLPEELWDVGTITQGEVLTHTFIIKNAGDAELTIDRVHPSCGCLATFTFNPKISPGESTELKITFDSRQETGDFEKYVYVDSNAPEAQTKIITVRGKVKVLPKINISIEPAKWDFASASSEQPSIFQFAIVNNGNDTLRISSIDVPAGLMVASISSADIAPHRVATVTLNLKPEAKFEKEDVDIFLKIGLPLQHKNK